MPSPSVTAIVLNYNGPELTLATVESLLGLDYPDVRVLVVDNGSTDDSAQRVAEAFPEVEQVLHGPNRGISPGINRGLVRGREHGADYLLVLNNDIEVDPGMLGEMVEVAEADPTIGCVGPKTFYFDDRDRLWSAGGILRFRESVTRERGDGELDRGQFDRNEEVDYVNGCAMLVRRSALEAAGLWNPIYFLGVEDADFCVRVKRAGFRCAYAHRALLWHKVSGSIGVYKPFRTFHTGRSTAIYLRFYARPHQWASWLGWYAASLPFAWLRERRVGNQRAVREKLRGVREGLRVPLAPPPELPRAG